jgi:p-aminobenzoyl-glutamate transporter AbgT
MKMNLFLVLLIRVVKVIYMFNLTNVGLNMCVKRIFGFISEFDDSDLFLN